MPRLSFMPCLVRSSRGDQLEALKLGHWLLDDYLVFVGARAAPKHVVGGRVRLEDLLLCGGQGAGRCDRGHVFSFLAAQRAPRRGSKVVRLEDGEVEFAARTIARRLSSVRALFAYSGGSR